MTIVEEQFRLRKLARSDGPAIINLMQDGDIPRWTHVPHPYGEREFEEWFKKFAGAFIYGGGGHAIEVDGKFAGVMGYFLREPEDKHFEIGYWIAPSARGRGIVTRAVTAMLQEMQGKKIALPVLAFVFEGNEASARILEKLGFSYTGERIDATNGLGEEKVALALELDEYPSAQYMRL